MDFVYTVRFVYIHRERGSSYRMDDGFSLGVLCAMWYGRGRMFALVRVVILASGATTIVVAIACLWGLVY